MGSPVLPTLELLVILETPATPATLEHQSDLLHHCLDREDREDQEICPAALDVLVNHYKKGIVSDKQKCFITSTGLYRSCAALADFSGLAEFGLVWPSQRFHWQSNILIKYLNLWVCT